MKLAEFLETLKEFNQNTKEYFDIVKSVFFYITHPAEFAKWLWHMTVNLSFEVCLVIFMVSLIFYLIGVEKAKKYAQLSFFSYLAIQVFNRVM